MSRMLAAFEALPTSARSSQTSVFPTLSFQLKYDQEKQFQQPTKFDSWPTTDQNETTGEYDEGYDEADISPESRIELVHSCEEISEQLLQIRAELQIGDSAAGVVQLRVFGA